MTQLHVLASAVKWKKTSDISVEKCVSYGFINQQFIKATVWIDGEAPFMALVKGIGISEFKYQFKSVNAAKQWATKRFNEICNRF